MHPMKIRHILKSWEGVPTLLRGRVLVPSSDSKVTYESWRGGGRGIKFEGTFFGDRYYCMIINCGVQRLSDSNMRNLYDRRNFPQKTLIWSRFFNVKEPTDSYAVTQAKRVDGKGSFCQEETTQFSLFESC